MSRQASFLILIGAIMALATAGYAEDVVINSSEPVVIDKPIVGNSITINAPMVSIGQNGSLSTPGDISIGSPGTTLPEMKPFNPMTDHTGPVIFVTSQTAQPLISHGTISLPSELINPNPPKMIQPPPDATREMKIPAETVKQPEPRIIQISKEVNAATKAVESLPMIRVHPEIINPGATMHMEASVTRVATDGSVVLQ